jgi:hypothetical protein
VSAESREAVVSFVVTLGVIGLLGYIVRTFVLRRHRLPSSARAAGIATFEAFQTKDRRNAVEEVMYTQESWTETEEEGDDLGVRSRSPRRPAPPADPRGGSG